MQSDGKHIHAVYDISDDKLSNNLIESNGDVWNDLDRDFKSRLQQYNNRMNRNKTYTE